MMPTYLANELGVPNVLFAEAAVTERLGPCCSPKIVSQLTHWMVLRRPRHVASHFAR